MNRILKKMVLFVVSFVVCVSNVVVTNVLASDVGTVLGTVDAKGSSSVVIGVLVIGTILLLVVGGFVLYNSSKKTAKA